MKYVIYASIILFTILFSTLIGYLIPMMYREQKFKKFWKKCPNCEKEKSKDEIYNVFNFWKFGGYCKKHKTPVYKNILFTVLFTIFSLSPFLIEYIFTNNIITVNSICTYIVSMMLIYATITDFKGLVIPDMCHIVFFVVGLFVTIYTSFFPTENSIHWSAHLIGMICISLPFFLMCLLGKSGFGDVKMFATIGLLLGWKKLLLVFLIAVVLGCLYALFKRITSKDLKWKSEVPFGPFICIGTYIAMTIGDYVIRAYLQLF